MLVLVTTFLSIAASAISTHVDSGLMKRSLQPGLAGNAAWDGSTFRCPPGSNVFLDKWCCPEGYEFDTNSGQFTSYICCPVGGPECSKQVLDCPICADSSWTYWDIGGTNVPPTLPFCCEQGYAPSELQEPQPANVCTSGANLATDYAPASQCGNVADATGSASSASAASATATPTESAEGASTTSGEATASATASAGGSSGSGAASLSMNVSKLALMMSLLLSPGVLMLML
ncbi:hypothetical protein H2200_004168 [Cladophialophora chaetospira]|uniref:Uncharacterized protein n=1 Tax=Cladophialophora chaetospira TaxID=386627 RepID=A0AA38XG96_9EURO|nr:hypothetical protein H2200_004168 [Cladophialophora chaetospira]